MNRCLSCLVAVAVAGCASPAGRPDMSELATNAAQDRALTQWKCTETKGTVLGRTALPMAASYAGPERIQYTIGVEGCGRNMNVVVVCAAGTPCFVAGTDNRK
ncbi:MAG TPA: hypothetical protein VFU92_00715 [Usitatibacter sp.]|nr:hypothetical protein [Usitatibacter sp.]